ncbi:MAG TPA: DUF2971 domain-containing protein [Caulobacteraceae bacterium]|jgi:hypothetical protein
MPKRKTPPFRLYKYRPFSNRSLEMLVEDRLFFADPTTFNDPLDSKPTLVTDVDAAALETILDRLMEQRLLAELSAAAKTMKYRGPKTLDHIARQSRQAISRELAEIRYNATNPEYGDEDPLQYLLGQYVELELLRRYDKGIVSFAERETCPLMWSHYGDQHNGICLGYSAPADAVLHKVRYGGDRTVAASLIGPMLDGNALAQHQVDEAVLLRKSADWRYEQEWRLIGPRGAHNSPLELEEVVFGLRCPAAVRFTLVKAFASRRRPIRFHEIRQQPGVFDLIKDDVDTDDLTRAFPRRSREYLEDFQDLVKIEAAATGK